MAPPIIVTTLKFLFIALLYLFIARAVRVIYLDLVGTRARQTGAGRSPRPRGGRRRGTPRYISVTQPDAPMRTYELTDEVTLGKGDECDLVLEDTYVSTRHARLFKKEESWFVEDLGSTNGTYLNRVKVSSPSPLAVGDEIRLGKTIVEVRRS